MELKSPEHSIQNLKYIETLWNIYRPFLMGQFIKKKKKKKKAVSLNNWYKN